MKTVTLALLAAGAAAVAGCATTTAPAPEVAGACGTYGLIDNNRDGIVTQAEWNQFRAANFPAWDADADGRLDRAEFENCYRAGGFLGADGYDPNFWAQYWAAFDANNDGFLSPDEYWSDRAWTGIDANRNGRIDANEWMWWNS